MDTKTIVRKLVAAEMSKKQKEYQEYFKGKLKEWDAKSPADIPEKDRVKFFKEIEEGWKGEDEGKGKEASSKKAYDDQPFFTAVAEVYKKYRQYRTHPAMVEVAKNPKTSIIDVATAWDDALKKAIADEG